MSMSLYAMVSGKFYPRIYDLKLEGESLLFKIYPDFVQKFTALLMEFFTNRKDIKNFTPIDVSKQFGEWGFDTSCMFESDGRCLYLKFPIFSKEKLGLVADTLAFVTSFCFFRIAYEVQVSKESIQCPQLFWLETGHCEGLHGGSFSLTVSASAKEWIAKNHTSSVWLNMRKPMAEVWRVHLSDLSILDDDFSFRVGMPRPKEYPGIIQMVTIGNCACLGVNPEEARQGYCLQSHNVDGAIQQFSLIAGIVTLWEEVTRSYP
jgi:hypothetical protein